MGSAIEACCKEPQPTQGYIPSNRKPIKKRKNYADEGKNSPNQMKMNEQTTEDQNGYENNEIADNLSDVEIDKLLEKKSKIKKKFGFDDFQIDGMLGQGGFGVVYLAQLKSNVQQGKVEKYAIKKVSKQFLIKKGVFKNALDQKNILAMYDCKFIVTLVMAFQDPWFIYFVLECAMGGDTYSLIKRQSPKVPDFKLLGQKAVRFIAGCVILGLQFLHKNGYMYRDLKPQNVLLFNNGYAKLTDFGLAKKSLQGEFSKQISGTQLYYAPEMVMQKGYDKKIDLWTLGIYLYQLSNYEPPFSHRQIVRHRFQEVCLEAESNMRWRNPNLSHELKDLIQSLLKVDEKARLGAKGWQQVKNHAFFKNFDWRLLQQQKMKSPLRQLVAKFPVEIKQCKVVCPDESNLQEQQKLVGLTYMRDAGS